MESNSLNQEQTLQTSNETLAARDIVGQLAELLRPEDKKELKKFNHNDDMFIVSTKTLNASVEQTEISLKVMRRHTPLDSGDPYLLVDANDIDNAVYYVFAPDREIDATVIYLDEHRRDRVNHPADLELIQTALH